SHRINKAVANGAKVFVINPVDYSFTFHVAGKVITADVISTLSEVIDALNNGSSSEVAKQMADALKSAEKAAVFLGAFSLNHPHAAYIRAQVRKLAELTGTSIGVLTEGANASGAYLAGAVPHRGPAGAETKGPRGLSAKELFIDKPVRAYFFLGFEPEFDTVFPAAAMQSLRAADLAVCLTSYVTDTMKTYADVILPIAPFTENEGTFVNVEGTWQSFDAAGPLKGKAKPAWQVIRAIARAMQMSGFDYEFVTDIRDEVKAKVEAMSPYQPKPVSLGEKPALKKGLLRMGAYPPSCVDGVVRRAKALQETNHQGTASIGLNEKEAKALGFNLGDRVTAIQGGTRVTLPVLIDNRLADGIVSIPMGLPETAGFGEVMAFVEFDREGL
ncbi:MAG: molybdopterin-dependent oxidoreductase, partial [Coxiellaceae bacterium]|nr:molybdopterin-dependent oxidoreductase [Coxiellaceae bacterium]